MSILIYIKRPTPVMAAKAAIHAFCRPRHVASNTAGKGMDGRFRGHDGRGQCLGHREQKFFAELFYKKATAYFQ
jgi:hypothetical protein